MLPAGISKEEGGTMRNRQKQRELKKKEQLLNLKNEYGIKDPTPYQVVKIIKKEGINNG